MISINLIAEGWLVTAEWPTVAHRGSQNNVEALSLAVATGQTRRAVAGSADRGDRRAVRRNVRPSGGGSLPLGDPDRSRDDQRGYRRLASAVEWLAGEAKSAGV